MSKTRPSPWHFLFLLLVSTFPARAQQRAIDTWDVMGDYTCTRPESDAPAEKLFLLPDMRWDRVPPFTLLPLHIGWVSVQTRGWRGRLPFALDPQGVFKVRSDVVELYYAELVDEGYAVYMGSFRNPFFHGLMKIERPSALPPPQQQLWATSLAQSFRFDPFSGQLTEVLPIDSTRLPVRCDQHPLFTAELFL